MNCSTPAVSRLPLPQSHTKLLGSAGKGYISRTHSCPLTVISFRKASSIVGSYRSVHICDTNCPVNEDFPTPIVTTTPNNNNHPQRPQQERKEERVRER